MENTELIINILYFVIAFVFGILFASLFNRSKEKERLIIKKQAYTDQLTGRGNRYLFMETLDKLIKKGKKFAVCFMDLDGFKQINDTMGHDAGDELLIYLANTFETKLPKNATAYRLGGDEFSIVIKNISTTEDITNLLDELKEELSKPIVIDGTTISLEYSLGVSIFPEDATDRQTLIMYADDAMYYIKKHGKNNYYFHNKALKAKLENKNKMQKDLKTAYENKEFGFSFQPRIDIEDSRNICLEALLYWKHPVLGVINSYYFIKQADDMALTIKLDQYVLENVCMKLNELREKGFWNVKMAVNISNRHVTRKEFVDKLCEILNKYSIENGDIQIEIIDPIDIKKIESYKVMFERLKNSGASIIINDTSIKYENLTLYRELPISELKLSSKYVDYDSNLGYDVLKEIVELGKSLNYKISICQIEREEELLSAIKAGGDSIQGNFIFKPMEDNFAEDFLNNYIKYKDRIDAIIVNAKKTKKM